eukprot:SM000400S15607  [mRNA]  locus=s400:24321:24968:+ [translate_table: standard]
MHQLLIHQLRIQAAQEQAQEPPEQEVVKVMGPPGGSLPVVSPNYLVTRKWLVWKFKITKLLQFQDVWTAVKPTADRGLCRPFTRENMTASANLAADLSDEDLIGEEDDTVQEFVTRVKSLALQLQNIGEEVPARRQVLSMLMCLPQEYDALRDSSQMGN